MVDMHLLALQNQQMEIYQIITEQQQTMTFGSVKLMQQELFSGRNFMVGLKMMKDLI